MGCALIFHLIAVVHFYFGFWYDRTYISEHDVKYRGFEFGGRLGHSMHLQYFTIALLNDFMGTNEANPKNKPLIRKIRDYIFGTYAFPFALNVGVLFHVLMTIDRNLVMPAEVDKFFPFWLNHIVHTNIMIFIVLEYYFLPRQYPCRKSAIIGITIVMGIYLGWLFCINANAGKWPYPILNILDWPQRIAFMAFTVILQVIFYFIGELLHSLRYGKSTAQKSEKPKKKKQKSA